MSSRKFKLFPDSEAVFTEKVPISFYRTDDGYGVNSGTLINSGFSPLGRGITLPAELDGFPVTELRACYPSGEIDFIEAACLKRIYLTIKVESDFYSDRRAICKPPMLVGGIQNTLEVMELTFVGETAELGDFSDCRPLTKVSFNNKIIASSDWEGTSFTREAFKDCSNLIKVFGTFEGDLLSGDTFLNCKSLKVAPTLKVKYFGDREFYNCLSLFSIHLPEGIENIGSSVFENCSSLKDLYIPDSTTFFGFSVFKNCKRLEKVHLSNKLTEIPNETFSGCSRLKRLFMPENVISIGKEAFLNCSSLISPWLPNGLKTIGAKAFYGCSSFDRIMIPSSVESIGEDAFGECSNLVIKCYKDSIGHKYAVENDIPYWLIEGKH